MDPILAKLVIAGFNRDGTSFLGVSDMYGTAYEDDIITTGMAVHMKGTQLDRAVGRSREEVIDAIRDVAVGIMSRFILSVGSWEVLDVTPDGIQALDPIVPQTSWDGFVAHTEEEDGWVSVESI